MAFPSMPLPNNCHERTQAVRSTVDIRLIHCVNKEAALFPSIHQNAGKQQQTGRELDRFQVI